MNDPTLNPGDVPPAVASQRLGLAIASLVLGILALVLSLFVVGGVLGLVGLCLGAVHIRSRRGANGMAWWGTGLSIAAIAASVVLGFFYYEAYKKIVAAMEGGGEEEGSVEDWEGVLAPEITVQTLDGQRIELSSLRGKRVVLDFWATWCPPCVKEVPHFIQLMKETSRDDLVLVGISNEDEKKLKAFVKKHGVNYPIGTATNLVAPYDAVKAIPTTFFIDRKGVIQSVAVGYHDYAAIRERATAKDYEGEPKAAPTAAVSELKEAAQTLVPVELWSTNISDAEGLAAGDWDDGEGEEILVAAGRTLHVLSNTGAQRRSVSLPDQFLQVEAGRHATEGVRLLGYGNWGKNITVMNGDGRKLWSYPSPSGVDGAHFGDLDGDRSDEMVAGMNGGGGLHAVGPDGKKLWSVSGIGNVWNQAVISAGEGREAMVFATEAGGTVRVFDAKGKAVRTIRPQGKYCAQMAANVVSKDGTVQAIAAGEGKAIAFDAEGKVAWSTPMPKNAGGWRTRTFASGDVNGDGEKEWVFHEASGDLAIVSWKGERLATLKDPPELKDFMVTQSGGQGLLVTLSDSRLTAYGFELTAEVERFNLNRSREARYVLFRFNHRDHSARKRNT